MFVYNNEKFCASVVCLLMSTLTYNTWTMMLNEIPHHTLKDHIKHLLVYIVISETLRPMLYHHQGNHSYAILETTSGFTSVLYKC